MSPKNQRDSLTETYQEMLEDSGIEALDTELLDMKNVIEGSEDDIRTEITKAGGFATESQVLALTNARNKQLIKNYNNLLETRNSKERYLETALNLESQDREAADRRFETAFNMSAQIAEYGQRMQQNAVQRLQWLQSNIGFDGLYDSTGGNPYHVSLIEKTLGLPPGGLLAAKKKAEQELNLEQGIVGEYQFAVADGFEGSFLEYQALQESIRAVGRGPSTVINVGTGGSGGGFGGPQGFPEGVLETLEGIDPNVLTWAQYVASGGELSQVPGDEAFKTAVMSVVQSGLPVNTPRRNFELTEQLNLLDEVLANPKLKNVSGFELSTVTALKDDETYELRDTIKNIRKKIELEGRSKLKGTGTISDFEARMLIDAATNLRYYHSDAKFQKELRRARGAIQLNQGGLASVRVIDPKTGQGKNGVMSSQQLWDATRQGYIYEFI